MKYLLPAASLLLAAGLVAFRDLPGVRWRFRRAALGFTRFAAQKTLACVAVAVLILATRVILLPRWPKPLPRVYDEFSYLLMGETFELGRLTNPSPPHWEHFETLFVQLWPTYQSAYPVAQGIFLAAGSRLLGHPWWGVWFSMGLLGAAVCWMAQGWLPPKWALLGGGMAALQFGIRSYWMNSYWGGAAAAIGGAVVLGAWPRFVRRPTGAMGAILSAGLLLLANSRPWEGMLLGAVVIAMMALDLRQSKMRLQWRTFMPGSLVVVGGAILMAVYFWKVTGNPFRMPYQVAFEQYAAGGMFFWQPLRSVSYRHAELAQFYQAMAAYGRAQYSGFGGFAWASLTKVYVAARFFAGPTVFTILAALPLLIRNRRTRRLLLCLGAVALANFVTTFLQVHYTAPAACIFVVLGCSSLRVFRVAHRRGWTIGACLTPALCILITLSFVAELPSSMVTLIPSPRQGVAAALAVSEKHLVFVRYGSNHFTLSDEWIYNAADLGSAHIIWARDMGAEKNRRVVQRYPGRRVWMIEPDQTPPNLMEYTF